ncbi:choice-of-anchor tandem repeat GloVer-containing protein [Methylocystis heyeri]|uniref:NHL repeat containing protein n=1 Tax=Methylocystis heyeri TaxID=391905 RepID=A0A6B8KE20_9HYPH|nr:choice-of-anchor tandem repeat GloVer-containing protein [Methylocystis heyeri]QGM44683.1 hypothetical protein H2LOC_002700 [Methylocystis heyeri]
MSIFKAARFALAAGLSLSATFASAQVYGRPPTATGGIPSGRTTIYGFAGGTDAATPKYVKLAIDSQGALYGTSAYGGANNLGTVFRLTPPGPGQTKWTETVLYSFAGGSDLANPQAGVVMDTSGALYGAWGGLVYKLTPPGPSCAPTAPNLWCETILYNQAVSPEAVPDSPLIFDSQGALYGISWIAIVGVFAGVTPTEQDFALVTKLSPPGPNCAPVAPNLWCAASLASFDMRAGSIANLPSIALVMDSAGALYGTTPIGGAGGYGTVFKATPPGPNCTPTAPFPWCGSVLYNFFGADGQTPAAELTIDSSGNLYGTTLSNVFKLTPPGQDCRPISQNLWCETTLYAFTDPLGGSASQAGVTMIGGALYGTASQGGSAGNGVLFQLRPPVPPSTKWTENVLYNFSGGADGGNPLGGVIFGPTDFGFGAAIYGVTATGGPAGKGVVYQLQCKPQTGEIYGGAQHVVCAQ